MRITNNLVRIVTLSIFASVLSYGADILDVTSAITANDPTQMGRLSRDGIISDWSSQKAFPGIINPDVTYSYHEYDINTAYLPYLQITFDDIAGLADTFVSAYQTSYDPTDISINYLGDEGSSGNYFGVDPSSFQVIGAPNSIVKIVVNTTAADGIGADFELIVQGYSDTNFNDAPEPAGIGLTFAGMAGCGVMLWRKRRVKA